MFTSYHSNVQVDCNGSEEKVTDEENIYSANKRLPRRLNNLFKVESCTVQKEKSSEQQQESLL